MNNKTPLIVSVIVALFLGLGFLMYKISPPSQTGGNGATQEFDLSKAPNITQPRQAESDDRILGNPQAKNTMVAYEDLQCPACANFEPILQQIPTALNDTKLVFRHFPLMTLHPNALTAAYAAETAGAQGKFWEFVNAMYQRQAEWSGQADPTDAVLKIAQETGVQDLEKFKADWQNKTFKPKLEKDFLEAVALNVQGTPTLYFNGTKIELGNIESIKTQAEKLYR